MASVGSELLFHYLTIFHHAVQRKGFIEEHHEVVFEVFRNTAAVACGVADNGILPGDNFHCGALVEGIHQHDGAVCLREGKAENGSPFGGRDLGGDVIVGQIGTVVVGLRHLSLMGIPACPLLLRKLHPVGHRHDGKLTVVIHPGTGLVGLLEAIQLVVGIGILPSVPHLAGLGCPEIHPPGTCDGRVGVTIGESELRLGTHQYIHIIHGVVISLSGQWSCQAQQQAECQYVSFHIFVLQGLKAVYQVHFPFLI